MTQGLRISDAVFSVLLNQPKGQNLVWASRSCIGHKRTRSTNAGFWKDVVTQRLDRATRVWREGQNLAALASARSLNGPRAWEVDHLYLAEWDEEGGPRGGPVGQPDKQEDILRQLLDDLVQASLDKGAERVILRCPTESPVIAAVRHTGFFPYFTETLMEGLSGRRIGDVPEGETETVWSVRERLPQDTHGLFQLYSAATPQQVRVGMGFTLDHWRDCQGPQSARQWVLTHQDRIYGWAAVWSLTGASEAEILVHPDRPEGLPVLVNVVLAQQGPLLWRVPAHQETVRRQLLLRGFQEAAEFAVLVKTVSARKFSHAIAAVEA